MKYLIEYNSVRGYHLEEKIEFNTEIELENYIDNQLDKHNENNEDLWSAEYTVLP
jgi:hypothetical protein